MIAMLATVPDETARKVAADVRDYGAGYIRIDPTQASFILNASAQVIGVVLVWS